MLKPAPDTPWTGAELGRLIATQTDIPPGVVNVLTSSRADIGRRLTEDPRVDMISFTGSTATGRAVMAAAAATLKKVFLELGGKSAAVVLDDYDLATAAVADGVQRVHPRRPGLRADDPPDRAAGPVRRGGDGLRADDGAGRRSATRPMPATVCGPVISAAQRDRIESCLRSAGTTAARSPAAAAGWPDAADGYWIEPTVIAGLDNSARAAREEIFGPCWSSSPTTATMTRSRLRTTRPTDCPAPSSAPTLTAPVPSPPGCAPAPSASTAAIWFSPDVPFGGYKQSGVGREMGVAGFEEYLEIKSVAEPA